MRARIKERADALVLANLHHQEVLRIDGPRLPAEAEAHGDVRVARVRVVTLVLA